MKGIVLAGGSGTRLMPLTKITNKHLLPVGREPMIFHPVKKLVAAGIRDILVVTGCEHMGDVVGVLGSGRDFECEFTYRVQDTAGGIAQALGLARDAQRLETEDHIAAVCEVMRYLIAGDDAAVCNLEQQRRVQGNRVYGGAQTTLPLKLNQANVIPVIFASPHSGRVYSAAFVAASRLDAHNLRRSEDSFVDELSEHMPKLSTAPVR